MRTIFQDMSRVRPAPTVKRETAAMLVSLLLVIPFLAVVFIYLDETRVLNMTLGTGLLLWIFGRWAYVLVRGDAPSSFSAAAR